MYFFSILLTCVLAGWVGFYAWRQVGVPGARTYAGMVLCEALLALAEMLSMLSPEAGQALFWFNIRFLFIAFISFFWLKFVLEYRNTQVRWSKPVIALALVIPLLTQIVLWTNSWHGLWVQQEVGFHQNGLFWLADMNTRIPAAWFWVHSFYGLGLIFAGVGIILGAARGRRSTYRYQAVLLALGMLIAAVTTLVSIFKLAPGLEINVFTPGIGISLLLYTAAIFRFDFLKGGSTQAGDLLQSPPEPLERRSLTFFLFLFMGMVVGIAALGFLSYQNYERQYRAQVGEQLTNMAAVKSTQLRDWRSERLADAEIFRHNLAFSRAVIYYFKNCADEQAQARLVAWLSLFQIPRQYDHIALFDLDYTERLSVPAVSAAFPAELRQQFPGVLNSGQVIFSIFSQGLPGESIQLALLVPILDETESNSVGLLVLHIDPEATLYPLLHQWPGLLESPGVLALLPAGNGDGFARGFKFQSGAVLDVRFPFRNLEIASDSSPLLDVKIDTTQVELPQQERLWQSLFLVGVLILTAGAGLFEIWRRQQVRFYQVRYRADETLRWQNRYLTALQETTLELLLHLEPDTLIENVVRRAGILIGTTSGYIDLVEPESGLLKPRFGSGVMAESLHHPTRLGEGAAGTVWQTGQPLVINDYDHWPGRVSTYSYGLIGAIISVPLLYQGQVLGVLGLGHEVGSGHTFGQKEVEILTQFARMAVIAIENARLLSTAWREAAERKQAEELLRAEQVQLERLLAEADQARRALLSVVEDQKQAEEEIRRLNAELEQRVADRTARLEASNKELEAFAYSVSHDLRAPLRAIDGFSHILQQEYEQKLDDDGRRLLEVIRANTGKMAQLITDLLALSRVSRAEINFFPIDMTVLVDSIYRELASPQVLDQFTFQVARLPDASGDPTLIRQVWTNLISNAIKYTLPCARREIEIRGQVEDRICTYSIRDSGVGFDPRYRDKLFGVFQRLHRVGEFEGTGVGLAIVQRIVQRHGGQVWAESQVGQGAVFYFTLPQQQK